MWLTFSLPALTIEGRLRELFERMGTELTGRAVTLKETERRPTHDINGQNACFTATWRDAELTWTVEVAGADGNPRDGYGYQQHFTLTLPGEKALRMSGFDWSGAPTQLSMTLENCTGREWLQLRALLRRELGVEADRSLQPAAVTGVVASLANEGDLPTALVLARECVAAVSVTETSREHLIAWLAKNDPSSGGASMQTREAPASLDGWLALERSGQTTLGPAFARLCPFDSKRWSTAAPWFAHPEWPLERGAPMQSEWRTVHVPANEVRMDLASKAGHALTGWETFTDWRDVEGEQHQPNAEGFSPAAPPAQDGWRFTISRRARFAREDALVVHVTLQGIRREPADWKLDWQTLYARPFADRVRWSWLAGVEQGDLLLIVERERTRAQGRGLGPSGVAYTVIGSETFRARAAEVVTQLTKFKWHPVAIERSLDPFLVPPRQFDGEPFDATLRAMRATLSPERLQRALELFSCRCEQPGICAHRVELLNAAREDEWGDAPLKRARSAAWSAAFALTGARPELEAANRHLSKVDHELMLAPEVG